MASIGDLFVSIGVKGADATLAALNSAKGGLEGLKDTSFETKAALVGAFYALEQLFAKSGEFGTNLSNINTILGGGFNKVVQEYRYAAQQVGISNEQLDGSFLKIQDTFGKVARGLMSAPTGLSTLSRITKTVIGQKQIERFAEHPEEFIQLVQKAAQLEHDPVSREVLLSQLPGVSQLQVGLDKGIFNPKVFAEAQQYMSSDKQIKQLDESRAAWENLGLAIQKVFHDLTATHGKEIAQDIAGLIPTIAKLVNAFDALAKKAELFKALGMIFDGWAHIFDGITAAIKFINDTKLPDQKGPGLLEKSGLSGAAEFNKNDKKQEANFNQAVADFVTNLWGTLVEHNAAPKNVDGISDKLLNAVLGPPISQRSPPPKIDVHQSLNFQHPGTDAKKVGESSRQGSESGLTAAYRQNPVQAGGH